MAKGPVSTEYTEYTEYTVIEAKPVAPGAAPELKPETKPTLPEEEATPANPLRRTAFVVLAIAIILFIASIVVERLTPYTSQASVQAYVVRIAPEVAGKVIEIGVVDNAVVKAGDVLFRLDPQPFEIAVEQAEARLAQVGQTIGASTSAVDSAQARLVEAKAALDNQREQTQRAVELVKRNVYAKTKQDDAEAALRIAEATVTRTEADLARAQSELGPAGNDNPQLRDALAALETARLNLLRTTVLSPSDGAVTNLQLAIGQFVAVGQAAMTFIDARTIWINANIKENSLEYLAPGDPAEVVFDSLPGQVFAASVESIGWGVSQGSIDPATGLPKISNQSGWVRDPQLFPLRLVFPDSMPRGVRYGSQANIVIYTGDHPIVNALGWLWIRIVSVLSYAT
ncbi:HlyD family secretion protein [Kaistia dalseonensis]|uniref:Multidrug resistance efflux pump n=1 Tax=Kaistia dalseonensis TaxID=410840 RepID=A0ABU0H796_9HYPH|nr:HlyD family secretion protein [Kaistia dalseonensis]MCX5495575.1 HlyD family secretion protein [Kaistia dalseonensis]MDQ0438167.1 multidrug resistance efflux pump [Kaistia dalseonensis]